MATVSKDFTLLGLWLEVKSLCSAVSAVSLVECGGGVGLDLLLSIV